MSIKKTIMHVFSKKDNVFHTIHPETEVSQITDFETGLLNKLALTSTIKAVTALQTESWFGQLLKLVFNASGIKYNIAQNGYICFGNFFGGLVIQWGSVEDKQQGTRVELPVSVNRLFSVVIADVNNTAGEGNHTISTLDYTQSSFTVYSNASTNIWGHFVAIGSNN